MCFLHNKPREMSGLEAGWRTVRKDPTGKTPDYLWARRGYGTARKGIIVARVMDRVIIGIGGENDSWKISNS